MSSYLQHLAGEYIGCDRCVGVKNEFSHKPQSLSRRHASSCHADHSGGLVGLSVFDLLFPAMPLSLLDVLLLPLLLLVPVPLPAALLPGLLHGLKLARHVLLVFVEFRHVASCHQLSGSEEFLWFNSRKNDEFVDITVGKNGTRNVKCVSSHLFFERHIRNVLVFICFRLFLLLVLLLL